FLPITGMPLRKMDFISRVLALAEPVPFTVAILIAKSLIFSDILSSALAQLRRIRGGFVRGMRPLDGGLLHVPRRRGAAFGAQAAMHAQVLVFDHDPGRVFQRRRYVQGLSAILRRRLEPRAQLGFLAVVR